MYFFNWKKLWTQWRHHTLVKDQSDKIPIAIKCSFQRLLHCCLLTWGPGQVHCNRARKFERSYNNGPRCKETGAETMIRVNNGVYCRNYIMQTKYTSHILLLLRRSKMEGLQMGKAVKDWIFVTEELDGLCPWASGQNLEWSLTISYWWPRLIPTVISKVWLLISDFGISASWVFFSRF